MKTADELTSEDVLRVIRMRLPANYKATLSNLIYENKMLKEVLKHSDKLVEDKNRIIEKLSPHTIALNAKDEQRLNKVIEKAKAEGKKLAIVDIFRKGLTAEERSK